MSAAVRKTDRGKRSETRPSAQRGPREARIERQQGWLRRFWAVLGPGLITGAADDDPSGVGTYSIAGAKVGYPLLWASIYSIPLMIGVQLMVAKIAQIAGDSLEGVIRRHYPRWLLYSVVLGLVVSSSLTAGADVGAMAAAVKLLVPAPTALVIFVVAAAIIALLAFRGYRFIERYFKWLALVFFAYGVAAVLARPSPLELVEATFVPTVHIDKEFLGNLLALLGATGSPYLLFWQAQQEVEEEKEMRRDSVKSRRGMSRAEERYAAWDVSLGMIFSQAIGYFILVAVAATLFKAGKHDIQTAADAAEALRPLAGDAAGMLFAIGILATGALAVPLLVTSSAFGVCRTCGWRAGLNQRFGEAKAFYGVIAGSLLVGCMVNFIGVGPMQLLWIASLIFGVLTPPLLVVILLVANNRRIMGSQTNGRWLNGIGGLALLVNTAALVGFVVTGAG